MKRSHKVVLTLLVPAMAAFGCSQQSPMTQTRQSAPGATVDTATAADCDTPANPGEPAKPACTTSNNSGHSHSSGRHFGRGIYFPWFGRFRTGNPSSTPSRATTGVVHSNGSHPSANTVSRGGFGATGTHLSGGS